MGHQDYRGDAAVLTPPLASSTQRIAEGVRRRLQHHAHLPLRNVECECDGDVLTLRGCVCSYYLRQTAQALVADLAGSVVVVNEIEVIASSRR